MEVARVDDLAVDGDDDDLAGPDFDDRGHVLVGLVVGDGDVFPEQFNASVRSDVTHDFDLSVGGEPRGWLVSGARGVRVRSCHIWSGVAPLWMLYRWFALWNATNSWVLGAEMVESSEGLGPEEAFVPHVVEVFDDPVPPRLA